MNNSYSSNSFTVLTYTKKATGVKNNPGATFYLRISKGIFSLRDPNKKPQRLANVD